MAEKLERIFEYRVLVSKARELHIPLTEQELARLTRLEQQLPQGVPSVDDRDPYTMLQEPLRVEFVHAGRFAPGTLCNASRDGFAIITVDPPPLGQRVTVHLTDHARGLEYTFPGRVIARVVKGATAMGVALEGLPTEARLGGRRSGVFRTDDTPPRGKGKTKSA